MEKQLAVQAQEILNEIDNINARINRIKATRETPVEERGADPLLDIELDAIIEAYGLRLTQLNHKIDVL